MHLEQHKTEHSQGNPEEEHSWRYQSRKGRGRKTDTDQWNRIEPRINPTHVQSTDLDEHANNTQRGKDSLRQMALGKPDAHVQKDDIGPSVTPHTKINPEGTEDEIEDPTL